MFIISSCVTSNQVSNNRLIQKRKYNKGWHFNKRTSSKDNSSLEKPNYQPKASKSKILEDNTRQKKHTSSEENNSALALTNTSPKSDFIENPDNFQYNSIDQLFEKEADTILQKTNFNNLIDGNIPTSIEDLKKNTTDVEENNKLNIRRILSIIGWSLVLFGTVFAVTFFSSSGGVVIAGGLAVLIGFGLLIVTAINYKKKKSGKKKHHKSIGQVGFILIFILSLLVAIGLGFLIGILLWSTLAGHIAILTLFVLDIFLFHRWSLKRKNASN